MRNLFLITEKVQPSLRWLQAFPDGVLSSLQAAVAHHKPADIVWVSTEADDWIMLFAKARGAFPRSAIVVVSNQPDIREVISALSAGARGYCHAWASPEQLSEVAAVVSLGGYWLGPELLSRIVTVIGRELPPDPEAMPGILTAREAEVARCIAAGLSNKEIATRIGVTERTVKAHLGFVFAKLGVRDRLQLAVRLSGRGVEEE
ncbi:helix-turn-helix transcriptional regulator [Betaproteobacteria bacterium]|nr:helix-turn-helix transcriptional regulator [Betaproteobacteria bacterium]GHU23022.1 helix-turn-helix transcriptional regulator [Betaproteobacteria bacterium]